MSDPRAIVEAAERLRERTVEWLDRASPEQLDQLALSARDAGGQPWTVADVFRHLAESDRQVVLGPHLLDFLPFQDDREFEDANDRALERLRGVPRHQLRDELITWGRRLRAIIRYTPAPVTRLRVPTMFGRVSLAWFATLRVYDEWVHQDDVARALGWERPDMDTATRDLLAWFQLRALPAKPLTQVARSDGVVEVAFEDALPQPAWRFDLGERRYGPRVTAEPTVRIATGVPTWTLIAADRIAWREAEEGGDLTIDGDDRPAAEALLDVVRVV